MNKKRAITLGILTVAVLLLGLLTSRGQAKDPVYEAALQQAIVTAEPARLHAEALSVLKIKGYQFDEDKKIVTKLQGF